ncbi:MAG: modification methylase [Oscillospiraceae bacterium]|nr:modification methylase [Oscillospiraceae bacterium]
MANANLVAAKDAKKDEFYTQLSDIQAELSHYSDKFDGKVVFCNCDDPFESNFVKYFLMNFNRLGLKELIATGYKTSLVLGGEIGAEGHPYVLRVSDTSKYLVGTQSDLDPRGAKYFLETEANNLMQPLIGNAAIDGNGEQIMIAVKVPVIDENGNPVLDKKGKIKTKIDKQPLYYEAGDFRSDMCVELLKQCDIVCTNPPFSLFIEYIAQLMAYGKQFLIIGNKNSVTFKEIFPLIRDNRLWLGCNDWSSDILFIPPDSSYIDINRPSSYKVVDGVKLLRSPSVWFTNIDHSKRHQMLPHEIGCTYYGHEDMYPKYDNYDAINVDKTNFIPCDYDGVMGVPISFLAKYCPEQFEIIDCHEPAISLDVLKKLPKFTEYKSRQIMVNGKLCQKTYHRIFIKRR